MRKTESKQAFVSGLVAAWVACVSFPGCESPRGLGEAHEDLGLEDSLSTDGGGSSGDSGYVAPPELTNPLYLPPNQISAAQNICGAGAHYAALGACTSPVGSSFSISGKECKVKQASQVRYNGLTHCCTSCEVNANTAFNNFMGLGGATGIQIAPITQAGCDTPGTFTGVNNPLGVYGAIAAAAGMTEKSCDADPSKLKDRPGFIEFTDDSGVLNEGSSRSTFGFFIQSVQNGQTVTYFTLFSYDKTSTGNCATELFLFGPVVPGQSPPLVMGLAIDKNGNLLAEVPPDIADVSNYLGGPSEPVKPGVSPNQGCRACHSTANSGPNQTQPFPWNPRPRPNPDGGGGEDPCAPRDAGTPDAGPGDAGPSDAGPADAGVPDAGPRDAGPADAGPSDAGVPDAGPRDAGPADAGPVDAGIPNQGCHACHGMVHPGSTPTHPVP